MGGLSKGDSITLYSDLEALEKELLRYGDEDRKEVHAFIASLKKNWVPDFLMKNRTFLVLSLNSSPCSSTSNQ